MASPADIVAASAHRLADGRTSAASRDIVAASRLADGRASVGWPADIVAASAHERSD